MVSFTVQFIATCQACIGLAVNQLSRSGSLPAISKLLALGYATGARLRHIVSVPTTQLAVNRLCLSFGVIRLALPIDLTFYGVSCRPFASMFILTVSLSFYLLHCNIA